MDKTYWKDIVEYNTDMPVDEKLLDCLIALLKKMVTLKLLIVYPKLNLGDKANCTAITELQEKVDV